VIFNIGIPIFQKNYWKKLFSIICTYSQPIPDNLSVVSGHMDNDDLIIANRLIRKFTGTVMHSSQEKAVADDGIL
ncbi:hypothetical protein DWX91_16030, partial [Clostridium sp. AF22-10]